MSRARRLLRRILGRADSDWAGPDPARKAIRRASPIREENRHEVVSFEESGGDLDPGLGALASSGHRIFRVLPEPAGASTAYESVERERRVFDVRLSEPAFASLDVLRRDVGLGATISIVRGARRLELAGRMRVERGWPLFDLRVGAGDGDAGLPSLLAGRFPLASIVVVTYGNRELNRICLESLLARTEWPRYEVIVVDNGSTDGTPELLAELSRRHAALRVIALPENRGYPAACNVGLASARGDYLVPLNNDTILTRGWLTALHRHLSSQPRLGLVGPVTNAIANEARVEAGYRSLDDLADWASRWIRDHDGETFPIPMLAFFCVAIRREAFAAIGPLDEQFGVGLFEDGDYSRRARAAGWEIACARDAFVHHWQNASFRRLGRDVYFRLYEENRKRFEAKWGSDPPVRGRSA